MMHRMMRKALPWAFLAAFALGAVLTVLDLLVS